MYTVSKGPSKIVAKARRGIPLERHENLRDPKRPSDVDTTPVVNAPKPVFHSVNGKRSNNQRAQHEVISRQHAELINFVYESWDRVVKECEHEQSDSNHNGQQCIVYYNDGEPSPVLRAQSEQLSGKRAAPFKSGKQFMRSSVGNRQSAPEQS